MSVNKLFGEEQSSNEKLLIGTSYCDVLLLDPKSSQKAKKLSNESNRDPIMNISLSNHRFMAQSPFKISLFSEKYLNEELSHQESAWHNLTLSQETKPGDRFIQSFNAVDGLIYVTRNGELGTVREGVRTPLISLHPKLAIDELIGAQLPHEFTRCFQFPSERSKVCSVGKGVLPSFLDLERTKIFWRGRNVPNDELDLQVPIWDVDAAINDVSRCLYTLHRHQRVRVYDIRGSQTRPQLDFKIKEMQKQPATCIGSHQFYVFIGSFNGQLYSCDLRFTKGSVGKFLTKGTGGSVTSIVQSGDNLYTGSLDSYIRKFSIMNMKSQPVRTYVGKPVTSLFIVSANIPETIEAPVAYEEEIPLDKEEIKDNKLGKLKNIRKRNKVGLTYLAQREFPEPDYQEIELQKRLQEARQQEERCRLNPADRDALEDDEPHQYENGPAQLSDSDV